MFNKLSSIMHTSQDKCVRLTIFGSVALLWLIVYSLPLANMNLKTALKTAAHHSRLRDPYSPFLNNVLTHNSDDSGAAMSCPHDAIPVTPLRGSGCPPLWRVAFALRGKRRHRCNQRLDSYLRRLPCHVDVFWHHWSLAPDEEDWLLNRYKPKRWVFEDPSIVTPVVKLFEIVDGAPRQASSHGPMFRGIARSLQLVREYEEEQGFKYDMVISVRWDIAQGHIGPMVLPWVCPNLTGIYSLFGPELNWAFYDQWFYSNSDNMYKISAVYDDFMQGSLYPRNDQNGNDYTRMIGKGIIESDATNYWSCTTLNNNSTNVPMDNAVRRPQAFAIRNVHLVLKYYLYRLGLWGTHVHCYCVDKEYEDWFASSMDTNIYGLRPWSNVPPSASPNCVAPDSYPTDEDRRVTTEIPQV